jgi:hypothetical protein
MGRTSITKSHEKIQELSWEPTFVSPVIQSLDPRLDHAVVHHPSHTVLVDEICLQVVQERIVIRKHTAE